MEKRDRYTSLIWAGFGLYIAYEGYTLKLGTLSAPKSGFLIFWAGLTMAGLSLLLLLQTFWPPDDKKKRRGIWEGVQWSKGVKLMGGLLLYALFFKWMGFILSTFLLLIFLFKGLASEGRKRDLPDMQAIYPGLDWEVIERELDSQELSEELKELFIRRLEEFSRVYRLDVPILRRLKKRTGKNQN